MCKNIDEISGKKKRAHPQDVLSQKKKKKTTTTKNNGNNIFGKRKKILERWSE